MEEQIIAVLREHEAGAKTADLARKHGISEATFSGADSAIGGCSFCCGERASRRASTASTGSIARRAWRCATAGPGAKPLGHAHRS